MESREERFESIALWFVADLSIGAFLGIPIAAILSNISGEIFGTPEDEHALAVENAVRVTAIVLPLLVALTTTIWWSISRGFDSYQEIHNRFVGPFALWLPCTEIAAFGAFLACIEYVTKNSAIIVAVGVVALSAILTISGIVQRILRAIGVVIVAIFSAVSLVAQGIVQALAYGLALAISLLVIAGIVGLLWFGIRQLI